MFFFLKKKNQRMNNEFKENWETSILLILGGGK
jgi:hypothetical protein